MAKDHFELTVRTLRTVSSPDLSRPTPPERQRIFAAHGAVPFAMWAVTGGKDGGVAKTFASVEPATPAAFIGDKRVFFFGRVGSMLDNAAMGGSSHVSLFPCVSPDTSSMEHGSFQHPPGFRDRLWERLTVNIGIVSPFVAFYLRFLRSP